MEISTTSAAAQIAPLTAQMFYYHAWKGDFKARDLAAAKLKSFFRHIEVATALVYNIVWYNTLCYLLFTLAGFRSDFLNFLLLTVHIPSVVGSLLYYGYRFRGKVLEHSWESVAAYTHNFIILCFMCTVPATASVVAFVAAVYYVEPLLPQNLQGGFSFPNQIWEQCMREQVYAFWIWCSVLLATTPLWNRGYHLNLEILGRKGILSNTETAIEIVFTTCQSSSLYMLWIPIVCILRNFGIVFHPIHILLTFVELAFINRVINLKFSITHKLAHECKPIYRMSHIEHHLTKGTYPTTCGTGVWEPLTVGGTLGFFFPSLLSIPYATFQGLYMGVNFVAHFMAPWAPLTQWHILHHTVNADVYGSNIPTPEDKVHSSIYAKHAKKLMKISPFIRYEWLTDVVTIITMLIGGAILHYGFGTGVAKGLEYVHWQNSTYL